jgi:phosphatidylserine decarboxylase
MTTRRPIRRLALRDALNFAICNRIPRRLATLAMGRISRYENRWFVAAGLALWRRCGGLDLRDADRARYASLQECVTRRLRPGARPVVGDPRRLVSPCDAIVGACGTIERGWLVQAKDSRYTLGDLLQDRELAAGYENGCFATLRLRAGMYHRFHAPHDCTVERIDYVAGDAWNVNPPALARVQRLFCRNERAVIRCRLASGALITLVPVAAILVASIRLRFVDVRLHLRYRGPNRIACDAYLGKGEEMGWFEHGSTIIALAPAGTALCPGVRPGREIRMGEALMRLDAGAVTADGDDESALRRSRRAPPSGPRRRC